MAFSFAQHRPHPSKLKPYVWLDFTDARTVTVASGTVSSISNKGSYGGIYSQSTSTKQPVWNSTSSHFTNVSSATFDGVDDYLTQIGHVGLTALSEYVIFKQLTGVASAHQFVTSYGNYTASDHNMQVSIYNKTDAYFFSQSTAGGGPMSSVYGTNKAYRRGVHVDPTSATAFGSPGEMYLNGTKLTLTMSGFTTGSQVGGGSTGTAGAWFVGNDAFSHPANVEIFHKLTFDRILSAAEFAYLDAWALMALKGGVWG